MDLTDVKIYLATKKRKVLEKESKEGICPFCDGTGERIYIKDVKSSCIECYGTGRKINKN